jgi:uncharacterized OB-fold protein
MGQSSRVETITDRPMWESIAQKRWALQKCGRCGAFRYPPSSICATCHSEDYEWAALRGTGEILSWVIFHRSYFDDYPAPYNVVAVRLDEGPIVLSNLVGREPSGDWIGHRVEICYQPHNDLILPRVQLKP